jgi:hypothetical protein
MVAEENKFQTDMRFMFQDMAVYDAHLVTEMGRILEEFGLIKNSFWGAMQAQMSSSVTSGVSVDPSRCFSSFSDVHRLDSEVWRTERKLEQFPFKISNIDIVKQGNRCVNIRTVVSALENRH